MSHTNASQQVTLVAMNLYDDQQFKELMHQRRICGWNYTNVAISHWRTMMDLGTKSLFWITLPERNHERAGHISLASESFPPHEMLARHDRSVMTISTFFTLPEYRGTGLGTEAIRLIEVEARHAPFGSEGCTALAIDTMRKENDNEAWRQFCKENGIVPAIKSMQGFYERRGYEKFHEEKRYEDAMPEIGKLDVTAAFLRKILR